MKNQSDLIVTVVAVLCMLIGVGVFFGTRREAVKPAPPEAVVQSPLQLPAANVVMANSLSGGNAGGAGPGPGVGGPGVGAPAAGGPNIGSAGIAPMSGGPAGGGGKMGALGEGR